MKINLKPVAPYDFDLSAHIFNNGEPRIRRYEGGRLWQLIRIDDVLALATATGKGTIDEPRLSVELASKEEIDRSLASRARDIMKCMLNLDLDTGGFEKAVKDDPVMSALANRLRGLKPPSTQTAFESLVYSIIEQQISLVAAISMQSRLILSVGDPLKIDGNIYRAFPTPKKLASLSIERYRQFGLSGRKSEYIRDTARLVASGELDFEELKKEPDPEEVKRKLLAIRGVGEWTAEMTMIRGMQRFDMVPADDVGLQRHFGTFYGEGPKMNATRLREVAETWKPFGGLGCYYLVVAERLGMKPPAAKKEAFDRAKALTGR
jgi:DNA-3-methyladenine glycosylase II